jgi:glycyl-tRNA synthetase beta subunit
VVESGNATHGHRFLPKGAAKGGVAVGSFEELARALRERFVILDPGERASRIDEQLGAAAKVAPGTITACASSGATSSSIRPCS